jgi:heptaprenyl diphosphate synthase
MRLSGSAETRRTLALLGSLCLFLSAVEYLIPRPLPFMRIGLANLPLLLALDIFGPLDFFLLALLKALGQGIISGSLFSYVFLFSAAGTFSSAALMYIMRHAAGKKYSGFAGIGCAGAMLSNSVQLLLARYLVFGAGLRFLIPPFLASGFISGTALGLFCAFFCGRSQWYAAHSGGGAGPPARPPAAAAIDTASRHTGAAVPNGARPQSRAERRRQGRRQRWNDLFSGDTLCIAGLLMTLCFLFNPSPLFRIPQCIFFCFLAWLSGKKNNPLISALVMAGIVFCNVLVPYGKVLAELGPLRITEGSLLGGLEKAVTLEGLLMLSGACIRPGLRLPGGIGALLAESFRMLELMRERGTRIRRGRVIEGLDHLMLELEAAPAGGAPETAPVPQGQTGLNTKGLLPLAGMTALTAAMGIAGAFTGW